MEDECEPHGHPEQRQVRVQYVLREGSDSEVRERVLHHDELPGPSIGHDSGRQGCGDERVTDDEFVTAIRRLNVGILTNKALELVKRPATRSQIMAYRKHLAMKRIYDKTHRRPSAKDRK
jgi:hypothetical protein